MVVAELIAALLKLDPTLEVYTEGCCGGGCLKSVDDLEIETCVDDSQHVKLLEKK